MSVPHHRPPDDCSARRLRHSQRPSRSRSNSAPRTKRFCSRVDPPADSRALDTRLAGQRSIRRHQDGIVFDVASDVHLGPTYALSTEPSTGRVWPDDQGVDVASSAICTALAPGVFVSEVDRHRCLGRLVSIEKHEGPASGDTVLDHRTGQLARGPLSDTERREPHRRLISQPKHGVHLIRARRDQIHDRTLVRHQRHRKGTGTSRRRYPISSAWPCCRGRHRWRVGDTDDVSRAPVDALAGRSEFHWREE